MGMSQFTNCLSRVRRRHLRKSPKSRKRPTQVKLARPRRNWHRVNGLIPPGIRVQERVGPPQPQMLEVSVQKGPCKGRSRRLGSLRRNLSATVLRLKSLEDDIGSRNWAERSDQSSLTQILR